MKIDRQFEKFPPAGPYFPQWVPKAALDYLQHTQNSLSIRALARHDGRHASTVLRHVRKMEMRRDDILVDESLSLLGAMLPKPVTDPSLKGLSLMSRIPRRDEVITDDEINGEARRVLRRLCETAAFLAVAGALEKAVVMRETDPARPTRIAVVDRRIVQAFALRDWISCTRKGKIARYTITTAGRAALKRLLADANRPGPGFEDAASPFQDQHKLWSEETAGQGRDRRQRLRYNLAESPLTLLGRRKGPDGKPFLAADLVQAGERLREDFEMAQMGPRVAQNWDRFLVPGGGSSGGGAGPAEGPRAARERVASALRDLGPGLGDIAMRCCCFLEGMEAAEKRMGWSARSGKIVLRIALQRLKKHYECVLGTLSPRIG